MFVVGQIGLALLVAGSLAAAVVPLTTTISDAPVTLRWRRRAVATSVVGGAAALSVLSVGFARQDWRFAYVVGHARPGVSWPLRLAGIWAGPEGSLLLWSAMLALATLTVSLLVNTAWTIRLMAATAAAYGAVVAVVANPFERLEAPPGAGTGLQPVLEHPAMTWHPPLLYLGLVAVIAPTAMIIGAAVEQQRTPPVTTKVLLWALAALAAGMATGSNWAYVELGWGGYWAWDPIENAGLVAWLAGASLLHRLDRSGPATPGVLALAALPGVAAIWATTITRTGVLNSVHAFADRPGMRLSLMAVALAFTTVVATGVVRAAKRQHRPADRPTGSVSAAATMVLIGAGLVIAVGTYEPALEMLFREESFAVSGRFFARLLWPPAVVGSWARVNSVIAANPGIAKTLLATAAAAAVGAMLLVGAEVGGFGLILAAAGGSVVGVSVAETVARGHAGTKTRPTRRSPGTTGPLAHLGLGVLVVGIAGTLGASTETVVILTDQQAPTSIGTLHHGGIELRDGPGTLEAVATVDLITGTDGDGASGKVRRFEPMLISYLGSGASSAEVDTGRGLLTDVQVTLIDGDADRATYRVSRQPGMTLVWTGSALLVLGLAWAAGRPAVPAAPLIGQDLVKG